MATVQPQDMPGSATGGRRWAALRAWLAPERLEQRVRSLDEDPRAIGVGVAVGLAYAVLMAGDLDAQFNKLAWLVAALALAAPSAGLSVLATLAMFREPAGLTPLHFNATVILACGFGVLGRLALRGLAGRRISIRPEFVAIGTYAGLCVVQFLWVVLRVEQSRALFARNMLTETVGGLVLVILVAVTFTPRTRRYILAALVPGVVLAAATAVISLSPELFAILPIRGWLPSSDISARGTGFFYNPNYLGQAMAMAFILVARARHLELPGPLTRWSWPIAALVLLAAVASFSRGALVAGVAGVVVLYAVRGRRVLLRAAAVGGAVLVIGYPLVLATRHLLTFGAEIGNSGAAQAASDGARLAVYGAGIQMFLHHPLFGVGYAQFHYVSVRYLGQTGVTYAHDVYLGVAAEQGLPGIVLLLVMLAAIARGLWRVRDRVAITAGAMFAAFAAGSLFAEDLTSLQTSAILWITLGCALVVWQHPVAGPADPVREGRPSVRAAPGLLRIG